MAITLRQTVTDTGGKSTELTYQEMNDNLKSYYYSSSYSSETLYLYTTGSETHSIDLSGFIDSSDTGSFVVNASTTLNVITFTKGDGTTFNVTVDTGSGAGGGSGVQPSETGSFYYSSSVNLNTITFFQGDGSSEVVTVDTGSATGGATSPGGSNTHIQFNQLGSFGGESALTYTSASQTLTIDKSTAVTAASPNLKLLGNSSNVGDLSGVIAASATTQNTAPASLQFRNATSHGLGNYDTDVLIKTAFAGGGGTTVERTALTLSASGDAYFSYDIFAPNLDNVTQANVVGFNTTTGELTYFTTPSNALTRPTSATSVVFDVDVNASWTNLATSTGPNPTSAGQFTTNSATPASVNQIKINKTANSSVDQSNQLEDLAVSSSITITQAGGGNGYGTYRIVTKTDNTSYMTYDVVVASSTGGTFTNDATSTIDTDGTGEYEYVLSSGYNWLNITNNGSSSNTFRLKVPTNSTPGSRVIAETQINASSPANVFINYQARSGSVSSTGQVNKPLYTIGSSGTATTIVLDTNDIAVLEFTTWGTGSAVNYGLVPVGAVQVYNG